MNRIHYFTGFDEFSNAADFVAFDYRDKVGGGTAAILVRMQISADEFNTASSTIFTIGSSESL